MASHHPPRTPPMMSPRLDLKLHDSPFSDYFTDRSSSPRRLTPSKAQRCLLDRLTHIAGQILRGEPDSMLAEHLQENLDAVHDILASPDLQTRPPADLVDSGFVDDIDIDADDDDVLSISKHLQEVGLELQGRIEDEDEESEKDELLAEQQDVLERMTKLSAELRQRYMDTKDNYTLLVAKLENATADLASARSENENLRADNDSLRSDLLFDYSELLFLKVQLKVLEVRSAPHKFGNIDNELLESIERWKEDWCMLDARFHSRKEKAGSPELNNLLEEGEQLAMEMMQSVEKASKVMDCTSLPELGMGDALAGETPLDSLSGEKDSSHDHDLSADFLHEAEPGAHQSDGTTGDQPAGDVANTDSQHAASEDECAPRTEHTGHCKKSPDATPTLAATTKNPGVLSSIWDALADATGVGMYDHFYDEFWEED